MSYDKVSRGGPVVRPEWHSDNLNPCGIEDLDRSFVQGGQGPPKAENGVGRKMGRVAPGDRSPGAPTDPDLPN